MDPSSFPLEQPELETARLRLRGPRPADIDTIVWLGAERALAAGMLTFPHPYTRDDAEAWLARQAGGLARGDAVNFAVADRETDALIGAVGLHLDGDHRRAEMGYWIGKPYWNRGYATEAARAVVSYGFERLGLNRIQAAHFPRNPASGAVLRKIGMRCEGTLRQYYLKWGVFEDAVIYSMLRGEHPGR